MPQPRIYTDAAARQRAYRARLAERAAAADTRVPGYRKWRAAIQGAYDALEATYEEINIWKQERSERWQESDRAGDLEADYEALAEVLEQLAGLAVLAPGA